MCLYFISVHIFILSTHLLFAVHFLMENIFEKQPFTTTGHSCWRFLFWYFASLSLNTQQLLVVVKNCIYNITLLFENIFRYVVNEKTEVNAKHFYHGIWFDKVCDICIEVNGKHLCHDFGFIGVYEKKSFVPKNPVHLCRRVFRLFKSAEEFFECGFKQLKISSVHKCISIQDRENRSRDLQGL